MNDAVKRIKALADPHRLRALHLVARRGECCVCEIQQVLGLTPLTASRNLRILEEAGWVAKRRHGKWMHYRAAEVDGRWWRVRDALLAVLDDEPTAADDLARHAAWLGADPACAPEPATGEEPRLATSGGRR